MYEPLQIKAPQTGNAKNPPLNPPSEYKPPGGLYLENCPQIQSKQSQNVLFDVTIVLRITRWYRRVFRKRAS